MVIADATLPDTWTRLQLDRARAVAVMTSHDLANIETGLAVRDLLGARWADVPVVLRLFDQRLAQTVETSFDFRFVRSSAALAAPWFIGAVLGLEVVDTFYVGDRPMLAARCSPRACRRAPVAARLSVSAGGGLDGLAMHELVARIRVVSLVRADATTERRPRRETRLSAGDAAYLVGPYDELLDLLRRHTVAGTAAGGVRRPA